MRDRTACFTGHRTIPVGQYDTLLHRLENAIIRLIGRGYRFFGAGGALGFDTMAAQSVLSLREQYPHIRLILVLPRLSQSRNWNASDQKIYERIKSEADKVVYTSQAYTRDCMYRRNRHLVDCSSACVCYLTQSTGGTAYTVAYAWRKGLEIINIAQEGSTSSSPGVASRLCKPFFHPMSRGDCLPHSRFGSPNVPKIRTLFRTIHHFT